MSSLIGGVETARCWECSSEDNVSVHEANDNEQVLLCENCAEKIHELETANGPVEL